MPAHFNVVSGNKALITLTRPDGSPVPFGSSVSVLTTDIFFFLHMIDYQHNL